MDLILLLLDRLLSGGADLSASIKMEYDGVSHIGADSICNRLKNIVGCDVVENVRVKNCGDYYAYQLNPQVKEGAYCVYSESDTSLQQPDISHPSC